MLLKKFNNQNSLFTDEWTGTYVFTLHCLHKLQTDVSSVQILSKVLVKSSYLNHFELMKLLYYKKLIINGSIIQSY